MAVGSLYQKATLAKTVPKKLFEERFVAVNFYHFKCLLIPVRACDVKSLQGFCSQRGVDWKGHWSKFHLYRGVFLEAF